MIALTKDATQFPYIPGAVECVSLEAMTGADVLISPIDMPCSKPALIREHLANGAVLVQVKIGPDLAASIPDRRLNFSLCRMKELTSNSFQRWLITTGLLTDRESDDRAWFDGVPLATLAPGLAHVGYRACQTALRHWSMRGGRYLNVARLSDLPVALQDFERDLYKAYTNPVQDIYPDAPRLEEDSDDPLQLVRQVRDWRVMLIASKCGIGPELAQVIYERSKGNAGFALADLTDPSPSRKLPKGLTLAKIERFRKMLNLADNEMLTVERIRNADEKEY